MFFFRIGATYFLGSGSLQKNSPVLTSNSKVTSSTIRSPEEVMSVRNAIGSLLAFSTLALLVGCGSSSPVAKAPPSGGFAPSDFTGTYVFSTLGQDPNSAFIGITGTLAANGNSGITGGTVDLIGPDFLAVPAAQPVTSGSYSVSADGRGEIHFTTTTLNSVGASVPITLSLDFVLTSDSHGLITEFDGNGTGSGTIDLQTAVTQSQLAGSYAFGVSGEGSGGSTFAIVGALAMNSDGSGNITGGLEDVNNGGSYLGQAAITASSSLTAGAGSAPGTAVIATSNEGTYSFDVYAIDSTHLKLVENDGLAYLSGDAYTQGTSIPSGQLVYTLAGLDLLNEDAPFDAAGWITNTNGSITNGIEDYNDGGNVVLGLGITSGTFTALSGGRSQLTLNNFVNGENDVQEAYTFAAYPFTYNNGATGIQLLEIDDAGVTTGTAYPQTSTTLAATQGYGFNLSGYNENGEEDDIAEFVTTSTGFSGIVDTNTDASPAPDQALDGSYTAADANGRGSVTTTNYIDFNFYVVNPTTYVFLETDSSQVALGTFEQQGSPTAGSAQGVASMLRAPVRAHAAQKKRK
jgi:hypothetical protein